MPESNRPDPPLDLGALCEQLRRCDEVLPGLGLVEFLKQLARLVFVSWVAPEGEQGIRREGDEVVEGEPPGDVFNVRVEAAVFMDHQNRRQFALRLRGSGHVSACLAVSLRGIELDRFGPNARIIGLDYGSQKVGAELIEQHRCGHAADGEFSGLVEKGPAVDRSVHVGVEEAQNFLIEFVGGLALQHALPPTGAIRRSVARAALRRRGM
jgi:hypothetical protein